MADDVVLGKPSSFQSLYFQLERVERVDVKFVMNVTVSKSTPAA